MSHPALLQDARLAKAERIISYQFSNTLALREALQLPESFHRMSNKGLALLGDAIITVILVKEGLRRGAPRGQINDVLSRRSANDYLAQQGFSHGLAECVFANQSQRGTIHPRPMADTVEAIVGAVFNDSGEQMTTVKRVMETLGISWPE
ncbi:RNAse III [Aspergillus taichungensis]|uniref:RNAse III n=1 Tax=Aspergillus taichungensis TaxID=482145 RepID=A0A2J5HUE9_9EURO|nr:RNAse III [Aspergillus taichungensis]